MSKASTIGLDLAKQVFQAHGADESGSVVFRKRLRRDKVLEFFARQPACLVAMEACGGSHYWAREIGKLGGDAGSFNPHAMAPGQATPHSADDSAALIAEGCDGQITIGYDVNKAYICSNQMCCMK